MSNATAVRAPARHAARPAPAPAPQPPRLRVVAAPDHARSRAGAALWCAVLLVAGLVTLLLLQNSLTEGAYDLRTAQQEARKLGEEEQALREQLEKLKAPDNLAAAAGRLGMVPAPNPAFLRVPGGEVLGVPAPGVAAPSPTVKKSATTAADRARRTAGPSGRATAGRTSTAGRERAARPATKKRTAPSARPTATPSRDG